MIARQIHVRCPDGESLCPPKEDDGELVCSPKESLCEFAKWNEDRSGDDTPGNPPTLALVGPSEVTIKAGDPYARCPPSTPPSVLCERGAMAYDGVDGDLTRAVEVRSPEAHPKDAPLGASQPLLSANHAKTCQLQEAEYSSDASLPHRCAPRQ